jgi:hypothetical protein
VEDELSRVLHAEIQFNDFRRIVPQGLAGALLAIVQPTLGAERQVPKLPLIGPIEAVGNYGRAAQKHQRFDEVVRISDWPSVTDMSGCTTLPGRPARIMRFRNPRT